MVFTNETNIEEEIGQHSLVDPDDPCNSYEWSIMYLLLLIVASLGISFEFYVMYRRKEDLLLSAFDIGCIFLAFCAIVQFGPMTSQVLYSGHNVHGFTQSGCKLLHYTEYGIRHLILCIILGLILYAWLITKQNFNQEQVDKKVRHHLPWLIILAFALEAIFGMPVAIYVDVLPGHPYHCVWTPTIDLSPGQIIAMEVLLRAIIPYLLPAFLLPWPLICLRRTFDEVEGIKLKSQLNSIIILSWCYIGLNFPYAVTFLIHYYSLWDQGTMDNLNVVCNLQWVFFLFHQSFFIMVPLMMLNHEIKLNNIPPGYTHLSKVCRQARSLIMARSNQDRTELV